jgi:predicted transposase/invertase (TIGR01784 family)
MTKLVRFDWAMKHLLRNKANFDILEGFLSELLQEPDLSIQELLESEGNQETREDKFNRVDVLVKTQQGKHIIVEVQCYSQWDFLTRILYGTSKTICEYLKKGDDYKKVVKVVSISIVFFDLGVGKDYLYQGQTTFTGLHYGDTLGLNEKEQKIYQPIHQSLPQTPAEIFPEYYIIKISRFHEKVQDKIDEWIYFLKRGEIKKEFSAKGLASASQKLDILQLSSAEKRAYSRYQEGLRDDASFNSTFEVDKWFARKEGREEGREEGIGIGMEKGMEKGMQKGAKEKTEHLALGLIKNAKLTLNEISELTGLSEEALLALKNTGMREDTT